MQKGKSREYAAAILLNNAGEILLQLRDNNPAIADPDTLSLFAGALLPGETKEAAIAREVYEETALESLTFQYLFTFQATALRHGHAGRSHVFLATIADESIIDVREGQGYRKIRTRKDLVKHRFAAISLDILERYFDEYYSFVEGSGYNFF